MVSSSQASQSQNRSSQGDDDYNDSEKIRDVIRFILAQDSNKECIKHADISKIAMKGARFSPNVINAVNETLKDTFGMQLVEVQKIKQQKNYALVNIIKDRGGVIHLNDRDAAQVGLLFVVLALILLRNNRVSDKELWNLLKVVDIEKDVQHATFGQPHKILHLFEKQKYLSSKKIENNELEYSWGLRAEIEIPNTKDVIRKAADIYGCEPDNWLRHHVAAKKAENRRNEQN